MQHRQWTVWVFLTLAYSWILAAMPAAVAQTSTGLYDPEPPVDSAYVRVLQVADLGPMQLVVDGKTRVHAVAAHQVTDYLVLSAGMHQLALQAPGADTPWNTITLDVVQGRAMTVVFVAARGGTPPFVLTDKTGTNKLKAMIGVYQLASQQKNLDVLTADGKTKVFDHLTYGTSAYLAVNPITTQLQIQSKGDAHVLGQAEVAMTQGGAYSIFILPGKKGNVKIAVMQNKVERYTGK